jgi:hypothetical protein
MNNDELVIQEGDLVTLYSVECDEIVEFTVGENAFPGLEKYCLNKKVKDTFGFAGETYIVDYIDRNAALKRLYKNNINFAKLGVKDFIVRTNISKCINSSHLLIQINALVPIMKDDNIISLSFPAIYCQKCNKYYIYESTYNEMKKQGYICCKIIKIQELTNLEKSESSLFYNWHDKSILKYYGYSVEKSKNLSDVQRQRILAFLIENNIIDKNGIVNYLESFILLRKNNRNMKLAIDKWKRDIDFVLRYKMNNSKIRVNSITVKDKEYE